MASRKAWTGALALLLIAAPLTLSSCNSSATGTAQMTPLDQANATILNVQKLRGIAPTPLGADNQIAFGTLLFRYAPDTNTLTTAILVSQDSLWNQISPEFTANYRRTMAAYSDPKIGGLFDDGGGQWLFDDTTGSLYLYRSYPPATDPAAINADLDRMARVVPAWETRWGYALAQIVHGKERAPTRPVTLADDPYAGRL